MGRMVGLREQYQIGLGAEPIRIGGGRFVFRDPYTGKTATGLMSVLEWNVAADQWVQFAPPQGDRPGSEFSAWVNKQLEVVWSQPIGRYRQPARPSAAVIESAATAPAPESVTITQVPTPTAIAPAPAPVAPAAPPPAPAPAPAPARAVIPTAEITTAQAPSFPAATTVAVLPTNGVSEPAGFAMPDLPMWAWIAIAGGGVYLFTRK